MIVPDMETSPRPGRPHGRPGGKARGKYITAIKVFVYNKIVHRGEGKMSENTHHEDAMPLLETANISPEYSGIKKGIVQVRPGLRNELFPHIHYFHDIRKQNDEYAKFSIKDDVDEIEIMEQKNIRLEKNESGSIKSFIALNSDLLLIYYLQAEFIPDTGEYLSLLKRISSQGSMGLMKKNLQLKKVLPSKELKLYSLLNEAVNELEGAVRQFKKDKTHIVKENMTIYEATQIGREFKGRLNKANLLIAEFNKNFDNLYNRKCDLSLYLFVMCRFKLIGIKYGNISSSWHSGSNVYSLILEISNMVGLNEIDHIKSKSDLIIPISYYGHDEFIKKLSNLSKEVK